MVECQGLNWNVSPINGTSVFFTNESFERFSYSRTYDDDTDFDAFLRRKNEELNGVPTSGSAPQAGGDVYRDGSALEKRFPVSTGQGHEQGLGKKLGEEKVSGASKTGIACQQKVSVPFPRKSWLSLGEQRRYLELYSRYHNCPPLHPTEEERIEMNILKELQTKVSREQEEFQNYLRQLAECNASSYNILQPAAKAYIQEKISHACKRVRQYPRFYETVDAVSLTVPVEQKEFHPLIFVRPLLELGQVPKVILPNMICGAKPILPTDYDKVSEHCPPSGRKTTASDAWNKQTCSQDWNAEVLAQKYGCKVVLSSGGLKCLLDNQSPGYQRDWQLPVIIKEYPVMDNGKTFLHKVVYIDKPLVNQKMTVREKNSKFHKAALKTLVCNRLKTYKLGSKRSEDIGEIQPVENVKKDRGQKKLANQSKKANSKTSKISDDFFSSRDVEMDSLETFGMSVGPARKGKQAYSKMAEADVLKPESSVTEMFCPEISTEIATEPVFKLEDNLVVCPVTETVALSTGNLASGNMATGNSAKDKIKIGSVTTDTKVDLENVQERVSIVSDDVTHTGVKDSNFVDEKSGEKCHVMMRPESNKTDGTVSVKLEGNAGEKSQQSIVLKESMETQQDVQGQQDGVSDDDKSSFKCFSQAEVSRKLPLAMMAERSECDKKSVSMESHVSLLDDEFEEEVIVIRRRRGRPRKVPVTPVVVQTENVNSGTDVVEPVKEDKSLAVKDVKQDVNAPGIMSSCEAPSGGKMCLRRSPRVLQKNASNSTVVTGVPVPAVSKGSLQPVTKKEASMAASLFVSDGQSTETSDDDKLVIAEPSAASPQPLKTSVKGDKPAECFVSTEQIGRRKSALVTESSDEECRLIIDAPEPVDAEKPVARRRSSRISAMSAADSTDADTEADTPKSLQKRGRKTRSKKTEVKNAPVPTESPEEMTERRRSGRLAARDRASVEPSDPETKKKASHRQTQKGQKEDSTKATSIETKNCDPDLVNRTDIPGNVEGKEDGGSSGNQARSLSPEKGERHLSEIEEIQEPSDMSEADADSSHPVLIPLSPVYPRGVTVATTDPAMQPGQPKSGIKEKHSANDTVDHGFTSPEPRVRKSSAKKSQDPLNTILSLQDKLLQPLPVHSLSCPAPCSHPTAQASPFLPNQSKFPPLHSLAPPHQPQAPPSEPHAPASQPLAPPHQHQSPPPQPQAQPPQPQVAVHHPQVAVVKENPLDYHQPQDHLNVTYHLWSFGGRPVLIRCGCHGYRRDGNQRMSFLTMSTKLEYQTTYGLEQVTSSELIREWIGCYIRQNCPLIRARVNGLTSEVVILEEVDAMRIIPQCQSHLPPQGLQRMNKVLSKLDTLEVGSYLLSHSPGDSHCKLRKAVDGNKRGAYDLHFTYTGFTCTDSELRAVPAWIPIDPAIILPAHWKKSRIPATFDPPDYTAGPNAGQKRRHFQAGHQAGHHNTGKTKKNKGKKKQSKK